MTHMDDETTGTVAMTEFELLMCRALCRQALRGLDDGDDECDLGAVFGQMDVGQKEIAADALRALMRRVTAIHEEHHPREVQ
jgi:hypothetical protein